jgi:aminoglycoside 3-N-acetyltransferase
MIKKYEKIFIKKLNKYINKNDTLYIELDLSGFNKIYDEIKSRDQFLKFFLNIFKKLVGKNGNIVVPSFSYSWGKDKKNKIFDTKKSPCLTGAFPNFFKSLKNVKRTLDPNFSCLIYGKDKNKLASVGNNSFGKNSIYEKLHNKNTKLVSFGLKTFDPTFVHYVEQFYDENIDKIGYRYLKKNKGTITNKNKKYSKIFYCFLRNLKAKRVYSDQNIKRIMKKNKQLTSINILNNQIYICNAQNFFNTGIEEMSKNKFLFTKKI